MRRWAWVIGCIASVLFHSGQAALRLRLAILDNPKIYPKSEVLSRRLMNAYIAGIKTALLVAEKRGVFIEDKKFFYGNNLMDVVHQVPQVIQWNPDAIVGLHNSNQLLMSRTFFHDRLVLSPFASDPDIAKLPDNFYSLAAPDSKTAEVILKFLKKHYPLKNLFLLIQADSKESFDLGSLLTDGIKREDPKIKIKHAVFLSDDIETLNVARLLKNYEKGDVFIFLSLVYYVQLEMMHKIADQLYPLRPQFISPVDNWGHNTAIKNKKVLYDGYRVTPVFVDPQALEYVEFSKAFRTLYHKKPMYMVSYAIYKMIISIVTALKQFPPPAYLGLSSREAILYSYHKALSQDPDWFRPKRFVVYKIEPSGERLVEILE